MLIGATVLALPPLTGTTTATDGTWSLPAEGVDSLRFSYVGYASVTLAAADLPPIGTPLVLPLQSLDEVQVTARRVGTYTSILETRNVESVTSTELTKAPCCNLGESFETNAAVDVSYRDPLTGAREMQVLGLGGIYAQLLLEKRPTLYGLAAAQSLDLIPGTWLDGIQIGKGAASVQTGANALGGQVNTELQKPFDAPPLFVNAFADGMGRLEANVQLARPWNERHATGLLLHGSRNPLAFDRNGDGFYEQPGRDTYTAMLRHFYQTEDWRVQGNLWGVRDRREGGQTDDAALVPGERPYRIRQANDRLEAFAKAGYLGFSRPATSLGLILGGTYHQLDNEYGRVSHRAEQRSGYANLLYASFLGTTDHQYTVGLSQQLDDYTERYAGQNFDRTERVSGAYAEYTFDYLRAPGGGGETQRGLYGASVIAGLRVDHHSLGGWQALPRLSLKVNPTEGLALRASAGRAYRSAQVLAENLRLLPAGQPLVIAEPLTLTTGWTYGAALTQNFTLPTSDGGEARSGQLGLDVYATTFDQLTVVDQEGRYAGATVYNLQGDAHTLAALISVQAELGYGLELKAAYKYVDSRITYREVGTREVPYTPRWRGLLTADYEFPGERWRTHATAQLVGPQRLPALGPEGISPDDGPLFAGESPVFALLSGQVTFVVSDLLELYGGVENALDYRQRQAILSPDAPDSEYFNASRVYAPLTGRSPYLGLRYTLPNS